MMFFAKKLGNVIHSCKEHLFIGILPYIFYFIPGCTILGTIYIVFFTKYYALVILYYSWVIFDHQTSYKNGRKSNWIRNLKCWEYLVDYFPQKLVKTHDLNPEKNYLICFFPHGTLFTGILTFLANDRVKDVYKLFPGFNVFGLTMNVHFLIPFTREFMLAIGALSVSRKTILYQLNNHQGNLLFISPGGAAEFILSQPNQYKIIIKNRKGFIKICLETGTSPVPCVMFRDVDLYNILTIPDNSSFGIINKYCNKFFGFKPFLIFGAGLLNMFPRRVPVTTVVGKPIPVKKIENPSDDEVNELHQVFLDELIKLFESHKHQYLDNPKDINLIIE